MNKTFPVMAVVIVVLVVAIVLVYYPNIIPKTTTSSSTTAVPIAMTDPAETPANTTSLFISYLSFKVTYADSNGSTGIVSINSSGSINLLSLVNSSKVLASADLPLSSTIKSIQFAVASANITINGTTYSVRVPSPIITVTVPKGFNKINGSSALILDFTPAVVTVYTSNSTEYVLVPSLLALSSTGLTNRAVGSEEHVPTNINRSLFSERPNITITSASLQQVGNITKISVTVKDNSNEAVLLQHLRLKMINGFKLSTFNFSANVSNNTISSIKEHKAELQNEVSAIKSNMSSIIDNLNKSLLSNLSSINASLRLGGYNLSGGDQTIENRFDDIKTRVNSQLNTVENQMEQNIVANENRVNILSRIAEDRSINFFISSNATLFLPFSGFTLFNMPVNVSHAQVERINSTDVNVSYDNSGISNTVRENSDFALPVNFGYNLSAGNSVTLNFSAEINLGEGLLALELVPGTQYDLYLQGTNGARASYSVNATS